MLNDGKGLILCHLRKVAYETEEDFYLNNKRKHEEISSEANSNRMENGNLVLASPTEVMVPKDGSSIKKRPFKVLMRDGHNMKGNARTIQVKTFCYEKFPAGNFVNSKRLMEKIGKYKNESYSELYLMLYTEIP